jgi:hypothetical protein
MKLKDKYLLKLLSLSFRKTAATKKAQLACSFFFILQ